MKDQEIAQSEKKETKLSIAIATILIGLFLTNLSYLMQNRTGISYLTISTICKVGIFIALFACIKIYIERFNRFLLVFLFATAFVYLLNSILFNNDDIFPVVFSAFVMNAIPAVISFSAIRDYDNLILVLQKTSLIISGVLLVVNILGLLSNFSETYSMGFANSMTLPTIILIEQLFNERPSIKTKIALIIAVLNNLLVVVIYGSRGAFIAIVFFTVFLCLRQFIEKRNMYFLIIILVSFLITLFYQSILSSFFVFLGQHGYSSRTLSLLLNNAMHDSGRIKLWSMILSEIGKEPFKIRGIGADILLTGSYSHNYFIELIYAFGVLIGGIFSIYIMIKILKTIIMGFKNSFTRIDILLLFSFFPVCLWSGSIWDNIYFWAWFTVIHVSKSNMRYRSIRA